MENFKINPTSKQNIIANLKKWITFYALFCICALKSLIFNYSFNLILGIYLTKQKKKFKANQIHRLPKRRIILELVDQCLVCYRNGRPCLFNVKEEVSNYHRSEKFHITGKGLFSFHLKRICLILENNKKMWSQFNISRLETVTQI